MRWKIRIILPVVMNVQQWLRYTGDKEIIKGYFESVTSFLRRFTRKVISFLAIGFFRFEV